MGFKSRIKWVRLFGPNSLCTKIGGHKDSGENKTISMTSNTGTLWRIWGNVGK